jgi:glycosyltransferase involved in cell wall biosynthesis
MIQKTPVLAYRSGGHIETIEHNKTGLLYDESTSNSLSKYMFRIITKDINTESIADTAYRKVILEYSSVTHTDKIISIYKRLV